MVNYSISYLWETTICHKYFKINLCIPYISLISDLYNYHHHLQQFTNFNFRYLDGNFDLDLTYITDRIIGM